MLQGMPYRCLWTIAFCCASALAVRGQSVPGGAARVRGEISWEGEGRTDALSVELISGGRVVNRASVMPDGSFESGALPPGVYELRVADLNETIIQRRFVAVDGFLDGTVLRPPAAARKEFVRASQAAQKGRYEEWVRHLQRALVIFPAYVEAHNDLGVRYMQQRLYEQAAAEFLEAAKLHPGAVRPMANLALAWIAMRRYADAESAARRAIVADAGFPPARRALSLALCGARPSACRAE